MIVLAPGHDASAKGASYHGFTEHDEALRWVDITANFLRGYLPVRVVHGKLAEKIAAVNAYGHEVLLACEIHFNSDESKRQGGSETLYCPGSTAGRAAAEFVQKELAGVFPPSRGVKEGWFRQDAPGRLDYPGDVDGDEAVLAFLRQTRCPAIIVEPEFIYNWSIIEERRMAGCHALGRGLLAAAEMRRRGMLA